MEKDISMDPSAREFLFKKGIRGVPAFIINGEIVEGFDEGKIESLINFKIFQCEKCKTKLRVPSGKGKLRVTCKKCSNKFEVIS